MFGPPRPTGYRPTPSDHPAYRARSFTEVHESAGGTIKPLATIAPFRRVWSQVPILPQGNSNSCLPHSWSMAVDISLAESNLYRGPSSAWFLYSLINNGTDEGSSPGDAITALMTHGICPDTMVPRGTLGPPGYSAEAMAAASDCRLVDHALITTWEEAVNAAYFGWALCFDIDAGDGNQQIETDPRGVCSFFPGQTDHEIMAGEQYNILSDGTPVLGGRNPWGPDWGVKGRCWFTDQHRSGANEVRAIRAVAVSLTTPSMPPPLRA